MNLGYPVNQGFNAAAHLDPNMANSQVLVSQAAAAAQYQQHMNQNNFQNAQNPANRAA